MVDEPVPRVGSGDVPPLEDIEPVIEAEEALAALQARVTELEDRLLRTLADLDNVRKRADQREAAAREEERARVAAQWLPVVDNLDLALAHAAADPAAIRDGVQAVREQALAVLDRLGFPRRDEVGARFDPARHEAVAAVRTAEAPAGTVVDVVRPGYGEADHQLRPAAVVVARERDGGDS